MIYTCYNNRPLVWGMPVQLKPGANVLTLNHNNDGRQLSKKRLTLCW